jgi:polyphosphate kinase
MQRNLNHRVEVVFPIENPHYVRQIRDEFLETYLRDNVRARVMQSNGRYKRKKPLDGEKEVSVQNWFMELGKNR